MSNQNQARQEQRGDSELAAMRADLANMKKLVSDMAMLFLPPALRNKCACGLIACKELTGVNAKDAVNRGGSVEAERFRLCTECKAPEGYTIVGTFELGPAERETVRLANSILAGTR